MRSVFLFIRPAFCVKIDRRKETGMNGFKKGTGSL